jgi:hypothetical protein
MVHGTIKKMLEVIKGGKDNVVNYSRDTNVDLSYAYLAYVLIL